MKSTRKYVAVAVVAATAVLGTSGLASAKGNGSGSSGTKTTQPARNGETVLTGDIAAKVTAAALVAVPGGTVVRVSTDTDDGGAYEAQVTDAAGARVKVIFDANVVVIKTIAGGGGKGGTTTTTTLPTDVVAQVTAAALAAVPGGTVNRVESRPGATAAFEAHVTDAAGKRVTVKLDSSYKVLSIVTEGTKKRK